MRVWCDWLDEAGIMAKSADKEHTPDGKAQTLSEHTYQVLERLADQVRLRPQLPELIGDPHLWDRLYWGCLQHDFGKAAAEFQQRLQTKPPENRWSREHHRHEALSLGFVDWLYPVGDPDRDYVIAVIACHHKDAQDILELYKAHQHRNYLDHDENEWRKGAMAYLGGQISPEVRYHLWRWLAECGKNWAETLEIPLSRIPTLIDWEVAAQTNLGKTVYRALRDFQKWREALPALNRERIHLYRSLILTADHAASGGAAKFPELSLTPDHALRPLRRRGKTPMPHQQKAGDTNEGSALLVAPTGSGKTEAAMLWAARQRVLRPASRLFYTLPYQASVNATAKRLSEEIWEQPFDEQQQTVTLQHSRATLRFYQDRMEIEDNPRAAKRVALERRNKTGLNYYPVQVFSPYQMLKAAYSLKGYETFLLDYTDALFIFDEIHAYEPKRLALIIPFMGWLARHYRARFLIMTATLPPMLAKLLEQALPGIQCIRANRKTFIASRRHMVRLRDGEIFGYVDEIVERYQSGESVLVCCNTVGRAQAMYDLLAHRIPKWQSDDAGDLCLLHSRFHLKDRTQKERWLFQRVPVRQNADDPHLPTVIVATQVVEVSLNVDFDTLYSDPAPLEALLQRFGRVNRGRGSDEPLHEVNVCRSPVSEDESKPYDYRLVVRALETLPEGAIDEGGVSSLLRTIYTDALETEWIETYHKAAMSFERDILGAMETFTSADKDREKQFYRNFDGQQVLPKSCADDYEKAFAKGRRLAASEYLVSISDGQFWRLRGTGVVKPYDDTDNQWLWTANLPYDSEYGLRFEVPISEDDA